MPKLTFSLDNETVSTLRKTATRTGKPQSLIVCEAVAHYATQEARLSDADRERMLGVLRRGPRTAEEIADPEALLPAEDARGFGAALYRSLNRPQGRDNPRLYSPRRIGMTRRAGVGALLGVLCAAGLAAQAGRPQFSQVFPREEFAARRARIYDAIGGSALAVLQGAPAVHSSTIFRQSNEFFYVTGITVPHAYVLLDGATRKATLYLTALDERRALTEGDLWSPRDAAEITRQSGIDEVRALDQLTGDLKARAATPTIIYTPFQPAEGDSESRDGARRRNGDAAADPWDGRPTRESRFVDTLKARLPGVEVKDLSPTLDDMRAIKSAAEIAVIERATRIGGEAILEAMRSTEPGVKEQEIDALSRFIFVRHGAQGEAYRAIVASGPSAWNAHHRAGDRVMPAGELAIMDYCPDLSYYRCDVTRMWPVDGRFNAWQRELYGFYLGIYEAILYSIKPNVTGQQVLQEAVGKMDKLLAAATFSKPEYAKAAQAFVDAYRRQIERPNASLGHGVGMSTHDMGGGSGLLRPGMVFSIEPQFRVPEEQIYIRLEDMIVITASGARIISDWLPRDIAGVETVMKEEGLLQKYPKLTITPSSAER